MKVTRLWLSVLLLSSTSDAFAQVRTVTCGEHTIRVGGAQEAMAFQNYLDNAASDNFASAMRELRSIGKDVFIEMSPNNFLRPEIVSNSRQKADLDSRRRLNYTRSLIGENLASVNDLVICTPSYKAYRFEYAMGLALETETTLASSLVQLGADPNLNAGGQRPFTLVALLPPATSSHLLAKILSNNANLFKDIPSNDLALFAIELSKPARKQQDVARLAVEAGMNPNLKTEPPRGNNNVYWTWLDIANGFNNALLAEYLVSVGGTANSAAADEVALCGAVTRNSTSDVISLLSKGVARGHVGDLPCLPFEHVTHNASPQTLRALLAATLIDGEVQSQNVAQIGNVLVLSALSLWRAQPELFPPNAREIVATWLDFGAASTDPASGTTWRNTLHGANKEGVPKHLRELDRWLSRQGVEKTNIIKRNTKFLADQYAELKNESAGSFGDFLSGGLLAIGAAAIVSSNPDQVAKVLNTFMDTRAVSDSLASGTLEASDRVMLEMVMNRSLSSPSTLDLDSRVSSSAEVGGVNGSFDKDDAAANLGASAAQNLSTCLSIDVTDAVGDLVQLRNACPQKLEVSSCYGNRSPPKCMRVLGPGRTTVPAYGSTTFVQDKMDKQYELVAFACDAAISSCVETLRQFTEMLRSK